MTLRKCIWRGRQFISPLLFPQTFFFNISSWMGLYLSNNVHITFVSVYYHQERVSVSLAGRASAHCDTLRQSPSEAGVWSPEPRPGPGRGDNHDTMIYCGYHCSLHLRHRVSRQKGSFPQCHSCFLETSLFGHLVQRRGGVWERQKRFNRAKYNSSWINRFQLVVPWT